MGCCERGCRFKAGPNHLKGDRNNNGGTSGVHLGAVESTERFFLNNAWLLEEGGEGLRDVRSGVSHSFAVRKFCCSSKLIMAEKSRRSPCNLRLFAAVTCRACKPSAYIPGCKLPEILVVTEAHACMCFRLDCCGGGYWFVGAKDEGRKQVD